MTHRSIYANPHENIFAYRILLIVLPLSVLCSFISLGSFNINSTELIALFLCSFFFVNIGAFSKLSFHSPLLYLSLFLIVSLFSSFVSSRVSFTEVVRCLIFILILLFASTVYNQARKKNDLERLFARINKAALFSINLIGLGALFNFLLGNTYWVNILTSLRMLPQVSLVQSQSWWNPENGIISFYVTPGALCLSAFYITTLFLLTSLRGPKPLNPAPLLISIVVLVSTKTFLGLFCALLLILDIGINLFKSGRYLSPFRFRIGSNSLFLVAGSLFLVAFLLFNLSSLTSVFLSSLDYLSFLSGDDACGNVSVSSECIRARYLQDSFSLIESASILGYHENLPFSGSSHNQYIDLLLVKGFIPFSLFAIFVASAIILSFRQEYRPGIFPFSVFILAAPFQGDIFTDSRNFLPFLLSLCSVLYLKKLNEVSHKPRSILE